MFDFNVCVLQSVEADRLCDAIAAIAEVFKLSDTTMLSLEVSTLVSKYPDIRSAMLTTHVYTHTHTVHIPQFGLTLRQPLSLDVSHMSVSPSIHIITCTASKSIDLLLVSHYMLAIIIIHLT